MNDMAEQYLKVGDLVRRDSEDIWRVVSVPDRYDPFMDRARCVCARAPLGWLRPDGLRSKPWAKAGDEDSFIIADLELLPADALSTAPAAEYATASPFPLMPDRTRLSGSAPCVDGPEASVSGAEYQRVEIAQSRGPTLAFEGKLLCTQALELPAAGPHLEMTIYETTGGSFVAVRSRPADGHDLEIHASVVEVADDVQAARFAVLDHFDWDRHAQAMVMERLGWSLRLEVV